jgi:3-hydroxyisobutyrate dehydrogenase-like beta-hydroxyacid dehydrogenase
MNDTLPDTVGIVGLGNMGGAIAHSLLRGGIPVVAWDSSDEALARAVADGAVAAGSLADLSRRCQLILIVVVTDDQVRQVAAKILTAATAGTCLVVHSTVRPTTVIELADEAAVSGVSVVDAGCGGGAELAVQGRLTLFIGGDEIPVKRCWPVFEAMSEYRFHVGPPGAGEAAKLVNNLMSIATYAINLEAMQLGAAYGLTEDVITTFVTPRSSGNSRGLRTWGRHDRARRERRAASVDWSERMGKDLFEAAIAGGLRGVTLPLTAAAAQMLPMKLRQRDRDVDALGPFQPGPRCAVCDYELAAPFRAAGVHPECARTPSAAGGAQ